MLITILLFVAVVIMLYGVNILSELLRHASEVSKYEQKLRQSITQEYPVFTQHEIIKTQEALDDIVAESKLFEERLFNSAEWSTIRGREPSKEEEKLMEEIARGNAAWSCVLKRLHFMIEANYAVQRGEWTIAEARELYQEVHSRVILNPEGIGFIVTPHGAGDYLLDWKQYLKTNERTPYYEALEKDSSQFRNQQKKKMTDWERKFDSLAASKPQYFPPLSDT